VYDLFNDCERCSLPLFLWPQIIGGGHRVWSYDRVRDLDYSPGGKDSPLMRNLDVKTTPFPRMTHQEAVARLALQQCQFYAKEQTACIIIKILLDANENAIQIDFGMQWKLLAPKSVPLKLLWHGWTNRLNTMYHLMTILYCPRKRLSNARCRSVLRVWDHHEFSCPNCDVSDAMLFLLPGSNR
jgi:hypothetical protein